MDYVPTVTHHFCNSFPTVDDAHSHRLSKEVYFLTFDLEVGERVEQRALSHQLLLDGVLETHWAGVGAGHRQIRLHGWVNEQRVC